MKRLLSWLLVLAMVFSILPMSAFAVDVETDGDSDMTVDMWELLPGGSAENRLSIEWVWNDTMTEATASVTVPAGMTLYAEYQGDPTYELTVDDVAHEFVAATGRTDTNKFEITNDTDAEKTYALKVSLPVGTYNNPEVIEEMSWYYGEVTQTLGDNDGYYYIYTAPADGTITLYFNPVYDDEGNVVDLGTQRDIMVTNNTTYAQYSLLEDGVDNYGLELVVPVAAGDEIIINTAWVQDADGNSYPEATYSWNGNFAYPAGSENNPIDLEWTWDDAYANATASATVAAGETVYYAGTAGMILTVDGVETEMTETGVFSITNSGDAEATYALALATPVGAQANPEVIENIDGYSDTNSLEADASYYYIWTATEDGTVTLDVTDGANLTVDKLTYTEDSEWPISTQYALAEPEIDENWNYTGWTVAENLVIEVVAGEQLKIQVNGLTDWATWTTPAIEYTVTGAFEAAGPVIDENLKFQTIGLSFQDYIGVDFVVTKAAFGAYDNVYIEAVQTDPTNGDVTETLQGTNLGTAMKRFQKEVLSWSMAETITVTLYGVKGDVVTQGVTVVTSVEQLALAKIGDYAAASNTKACTALVNMLNYGAAVQTGYSHNADILPNANLGDYAQYATVADPTFEASNSSEGTGSIAVRTNSVSMQSKVEIQFAFMNVDVSAYELRYTVNGVESKIAGSDFSVQGPFKTAKIAVKAADMRSVYTVALYDPATDEPVTAVYTVSVEAYAKGQVGGTYDAVVKALLKYGDSVAALAS